MRCSMGPSCGYCAPEKAGVLSVAHMPREVPVLYQCPAGRRRSGSSTPGGGGTALSYDELHLPTSVAPSPHPSHLCFCTSPWQQLIWKPTVDVRGKETAKTTPRWF